ncbi:class I tRNA ligase family protein [Nocardia sp. NPDC088792]|uniref:class I tRNA ligase family protein n=1 Tax=Nocardia sp. NPDC088792 TaxID=3364332 RepID=UPI003814A7FF
MIVTRYNPVELSRAFGIDMSADSGFGPGAGWGRVSPGGRSTAHGHDEIEVVIIVAGTGEIAVDGVANPVSPGTVLRFDPFETHVIENTGADDLIFYDLYWRDPVAAGVAASVPNRRGFGARPVFVFSTPPTPNGDLHLGHLSGPYLGADVFVRFQRLHGVDAWHLTGSDDFQSYVADRAHRDGTSPADTAAHFSAEIAETLRLLDIDVAQYTVTGTDTGYRQGLRRFFSRVAAADATEFRAAPALFDELSGGYLYEAAVAGGCPGCGETTNGNICEQCGEPNVCADLIDPRTRRTGQPPKQGSAARFSLPLHEFRKEVAAHHGLGRVPARLRELAHRVLARERLDLPITHPSSWGVPPGEPGAEGQVIWVWPEMAYGFLHGIEALGTRLGTGWKADAPQPDWKIVHFFGYDNSFYHSVLYPVLYQLAFPEWEPDIDYHVNEFYLLHNQKFSTSRGHAVWGKDVLTPDSVDAIRFFLSSTRPEGRRTNFDPAEYERVRHEVLLGTWQRWLHDLNDRIRYLYGGHAPDAGVWTPEQVAFLDRLSTRRAAITAALGQDGFSLTRAASELAGIVEDAAGFAAAEHLVAGIDDWRDRTRTAVALELAAARLLAACATPVMPRFAATLTAALGLGEQTGWPATVELVAAGTVITLDADFFHAAEAR